MELGVWGCLLAVSTCSLISVACMQQVWPSFGVPAIDTHKILVWAFYGYALCHLSDACLQRHDCLHAACGPDRIRTSRFCLSSPPEYECTSIENAGSTGPLPARVVAFAWMPRLHTYHTPLMQIHVGERGKRESRYLQGGGSRWDGHGIYLEAKKKGGRLRSGRAWTRCKGAWRVRWRFSGILLGMFAEGSTVGWWWCWGGRLCFRPWFHVFFSFSWVGGLSCTAVSGGVGSEAGLVVWWALTWKA